MKRIISIFVAAAIMLISFVNATANDTISASKEKASQQNESLSYEAKVVSALEIFNVTDSELELTRIDAVKTAVTLKNVGLCNARDIYYDVAAGSVDAQYVTMAYDMGLIDTKLGGRFNSSAKVSYSEIIKLFLCVLGYERYVNMPGFNNSQSKLKYVRKVNVENPNAITQDEFAQMVYNFLDEEIVYDTGKGFDENSCISVLDSYLHLKKAEGVVDCTYFSSLDGVLNDTISEKYISIGGKLYKSESTLDESLLGLNVEAFYENSSDNVPMLKFISPYDNNITEIDSENIEEIAASSIKYIENGKVCTEEINGNQFVVFNDEAANGYNLKLLNSNSFNGKIQLINNDRNNDIDVIKIYSYVNYLVSNIDMNEKICIEQDDSILDFSEYEHVLFFDSNGEAVEIESIVKNSVVSVYNTLSNKSAKIIVSKDKAEEYVSGWDVDNRKITLGEIEYKTDVDFFNKYSKNQIGSSRGIVLFDYCGKAAFIDFIGNSSWEWGIIVGLGSTEGLNKEHKAKIYTVNSGMKVFKIADKINFDGAKKKADVALKQLQFYDQSTASFIPKRQFVKFIVNNDACITDIDTPVRTDSEDDYSNDSITISGILKIGSDGYNMIDGVSYRISPNATYLGVPTKSDQDIETCISTFDDKLYTKKGSSFDALSAAYSGVTLSTILIADIDDADVAGLVALPVVYSETDALGGSGGFVSWNGTLPFAMVDSIYSGLDGDGNERKFLKIWTVDPFPLSMKNVCVTSDNVIMKPEYDENDEKTGELKPLHRGDVIRLGYDLNGDVRKIFLIFDTERPCNKQFNAGNINIVGVPYSRTNTAITFLTTVKNNAPQYNSSNAEEVFEMPENLIKRSPVAYYQRFFANDIVAYYDQENNRIRHAYYDDLIDYKSSSTTLPVVITALKTGAFVIRLR